MTLFYNKTKNLTKRLLLRSSQTPQETMLWSKLRNKQLGYNDPHHDVVPTHRQWGSGIFLKSGTVKEVVINNQYINGWLVGVEFDVDHPLNIFNTPFTLFTIHTPTKTENNVYIWQLQEVLEYIYQHHKDDTIILAGDFNVEMSERGAGEHRKNESLEQEIREYLRRNLDLVNCWQLLHPNKPLPSTYVGQGNGTHIDGIFVTSKLQRFLRSCSVIPKEQYQWTYADHCAVVAEFSTEELIFKPRPTDLSK